MDIVIWSSPDNGSVIQDSFEVLSVATVLPIFGNIKGFSKTRFGCATFEYSEMPLLLPFQEILFVDITEKLNEFCSAG